MLNHFPVFEGKPEFIHDLTTHREGHGGCQGAIHMVGIGHREDFFGGDVGEEHIPALADRRSPLPNMVFGQAHQQVRARPLIVHFGEACVIQEGFVGFEVGIVLLPGLNRVGLVDAFGHEDVIPEFLEALLGGQLREDSLRPGFTSHASDAPLDLVLHGVVDDGFPLHSGQLLPAGDAIGVHALEQFRVGCFQVQHVIAVLEDGIAIGQFVVRQVAEHLIAAV